MTNQYGSANVKEYLDFDLEIRERDLQGYSVAVHSPAGEAQEQMRFPFDDRALRDRLRDLELALLRSGGTRRRLSTEEQTVQNFGRSLFEALLVGDVRTRYLMSLDKAAQEDKGLRLKLRVQPPKLAALPWEFLYDPDREEYLCFSPDTPIVRYVDLRQPIRRLTVTPPLRILGMVASPRGLDPLNIEHEKELLDEAIQELQAEGLVELVWLEGQTWRDLRRAMRRGAWHVFHFVGHGDFDVAKEEGAIALTNEETGREHLLRSRDLARLLDGHRYLRLVFLNSCEGARGSEGDPFSGTAATLVRHGIPAVLAMQYQITDKAAIEFSRDFYEAVADGWPVDAAVTDARVAVSMDSMLEWGTPVLYMRSPDGRLFDISTEASKPQGTLEKTGDQEREESEDREHENSLRQYRERVVWAWADGELHERDAGRLKDFRSEVGLDVSTAARVEREVMGETIESILERRERAAREKERKERLDELYAAARRSYQDRQWQAVIDVFAQIHSEDPAYSDLEGLLASAREALEAQERAQTVAAMYDQGIRYMDAEEWRPALESFEEVVRLEPGYRDTDALRAQVRHELEEKEKASQYREALESAWADGELHSGEAESLIDLANNSLGLSRKTAGDVEHEVMGDTIEGILERQKQAAREQDRKGRLDALYGQARRSHQAKDWQAVVDLFAQIHSEDPRYSDNDGLLVSAREALEIARRENTLRRYREAVEEAWADKRVSYAEAERLGALANELGLSTDTGADIEHRVIGATKEELLGRQKGTVKWFSDEKGYGFISPDDGSEDVFVYLSGTAGKGLESLEDGAKVTYGVRQGRTGSQATNVRRVDPLN